MEYKKLNNLVGWSVFIIATLTYFLGVEPTSSFWDCGEFITSAYKLQVGHPPGAPLFMLVSRFFSLFVPVEYVAFAVNMVSVLSSSFTILFLFWSITALLKKLQLRRDKALDMGNVVAIMVGGVIGALAYTFSDSFWFSAEEGEVYAMSSLFTAVVFWAILKYDEVAEQPHATRWLVLIAYLMGLSIGVHLLNLLVIPSIAFVYYFRNFTVTRKGVIYTFLVSLLILGIFQSLIIPGSIKLATKFELLFVNGMGLPFHSGLAFFLLLIAGLIVFGLGYTKKKDLPLWNTVIICVGVVLLGYSTYATIMIRSNANPPMDENNPESAFSLLSYLNREQYGERPLLYGQYWMAPLDPANPRRDGNPVYMKGYSVSNGSSVIRTYSTRFEAENYIQNAKQNGLEIKSEYVVTDDQKNAKYNYDPEFCSVFPRMYSAQDSHIAQYKRWSNFTGKPVRTRDNSGQQTIVNKPTMGENLRFFFTYQIDWMYWRYFMWNFAGRQNDIQGHGSHLEGNWLSGIDFIDEERLGNQQELADSMKSNKGYNRYYLLPFILGLIGLVFHLFRDIRGWSVVMLLFFTTGIAIVIYLNQYPLQPRERDYAYVGSFYAFAMWIGMGAYALYQMAREANLAMLKKLAVPVLGAGVFLYLSEAVSGSNHGLSYSVLYMGIVGLIAVALFSFLGKKLKNPLSQAVLALLFCLPVPIIMAADGWDDHSRAKRETAVAFAKNYLDSCAPNAILFTNGDNDTFPLWYAQEVEGYRTDVRIVNLSLLNTDWYIDQMKRKAYDSDPVPFGLEEWQYRQGTRDIVFLDNSKNTSGIYVDVDRAMDFVKNENNTVSTQSGEKAYYIPSDRFSISVDKNKVLSNGTVAPEDSALVLDEIRWSTGKRYLLKAQLMVLDLLATNNWERPIYFAVTTGSDAYMGLQEHFQLEGLTYRLVPIRSSNPNPNVSGRIAADIMYDNMINKFKWGNMDTEEIYMDENNLRMTTNLRLQFSNLADEFIRAGDNEKAKKVLDKCIEVMPEKNVPYNRIVVPLMEGYYEVGEIEKGNELAKRLFDIFEDDLEYFTSIEPEFLIEDRREMEIAQMVANRIVQFVERSSGDSTLTNDLKQRLQIINQEVSEASQQLGNTQRLSF
ncbi:MAG: protein O-mannosyl-transferase family [Luteibaculum sp.]